MSNQTLNLHHLDKLMNYDSLNDVDHKFPISIFSDVITTDQAKIIIERSHTLYSRMETLKEKIAELYGNEQTETLMNNFND